MGTRQDSGAEEMRRNTVSAQQRFLQKHHSNNAVQSPLKGTQSESSILVRVSVAEQNLSKCLLLDQRDTVWTAKQQILNRLAKDLTSAINYGLYLPPRGGRAGKFLAEERVLGDYALHGPVAELEFRYRRRVHVTAHYSKSLDKNAHKVKLQEVL
eukprot:m.79923 g.79923  ORF g.79923 m.79923 type:complete len:155 (+) comp11997_c0_seq1:121-585(+)